MDTPKGCTESACAKPTTDAFGSGKFPDVVVAGVWTVEAGLDTSAWILEIDEVDFGNDTRYIETANIYNVNRD